MATMKLNGTDDLREKATLLCEKVLDGRTTLITWRCTTTKTGSKLILTNTTCNSYIGDERECNQSRHVSMLMDTQKRHSGLWTGFRSKRSFDNDDLPIEGNKSGSGTNMNASRGARRPKWKRVAQTDDVTARARKVKTNSNMLAKEQGMGLVIKEKARVREMKNNFDDLRLQKPGVMCDEENCFSSPPTAFGLFIYFPRAGLSSTLRIVLTKW